MNLLRRVDRDFRHLFRQLLAAGWRVRNGKKHVILYPPNGGRPVAFPSSCSDVKGRMALLTAIRKAERGVSP